MKQYMAKRDSDGHVIHISSKNVEADLNRLPDGPYTLLNQVNESNPMPDKKYRAKWKEVGGVGTVEQSDIDDQDREEKLQAVRDHRSPLLAEADIEINKLLDSAGDESAWRTYRQNLRDITDSYKADMSTLDAVDDVEADVSWPTKP